MKKVLATLLASAFLMTGAAMAAKPVSTSWNKHKAMVHATVKPKAKPKAMVHATVKPKAKPKSTTKPKAMYYQFGTSKPKPKATHKPR